MQILLKNWSTGQSWSNKWHKVNRRRRKLNFITHLSSINYSLEIVLLETRQLTLCAIVRYQNIYLNISSTIKCQVLKVHYARHQEKSYNIHMLNIAASGQQTLCGAANVSSESRFVICFATQPQALALTRLKIDQVVLQLYSLHHDRFLPSISLVHRIRILNKASSGVFRMDNYRFRSATWN